MNKKLVVIGFIIPLLFLSGCIWNNDKEYVKTGIIVDIETYDFGATFSDTMCVLVYDDDTKLHLTNYYGVRDYIILNKTTNVVFSVFEYNNVQYNRFESIKIIEGY